MDNLESTYHSLESAFRRLSEEGMFILNTNIKKENIKIHNLTSRIKTFKSFVDKIERKEITDPFNNIHDLVGIRIVCLLRSDITKLGLLIKTHFNVLEEDNKVNGAEISAFGYQSVHFVTKIPASYNGPRYENLHDLRLEIQVRSLAMDAWASLSHYLDYKSESDVPKELRKDFFALSGLFYVADTHFEMFYTERQKSKLNAQDSIPDIPAQGQEINLDTITAYLWKRYPDREHSKPQDYSVLISQLSAAFYLTLDTLHKALEASADALAEFEKDHPPLSIDDKGQVFTGEGRYSDIGAVRASLRIYASYLSSQAVGSHYSDSIDKKYRKLIKYDPRQLLNTSP